MFSKHYFKKLDFFLFSHFRQSNIFRWEKHEIIRKIIYFCEQKIWNKNIKQRQKHFQVIRKYKLKCFNLGIVWKAWNVFIWFYTYSKHLKSSYYPEQNPSVNVDATWISLDPDLSELQIKSKMCSVKLFYVLVETG